MTNLQQAIYNKYLYQLSKGYNKPFKARKNFDNIDDSIKHLLVTIEQKILKLNIDLDEFMMAPLLLGNGPQKLEFFKTYKAITLYSRLKTHILPDNYRRARFINGCIFLAQYCDKNNIRIVDIKNGTLWLDLISQHKLNLDHVVFLEPNYINFKPQIELALNMNISILKQHINLRRGWCLSNVSDVWGVLKKGYG